MLGLSILAALPLVQLLSLGYFLESSARVARTGRLRDGLIGVRKAARVGGLVLGTMLSLLPLWLAGSYAQTADLIDPGGSCRPGLAGGPGDRDRADIRSDPHGLRRGGRLRHFFWPVGIPFWLARGLKAGGLYTGARDGFWEFTASLRLPYYFHLGLVGFLGTLVWLVVPGQPDRGQRPVPGARVPGGFLLAFVAPSLPFLQVRYAVEGQVGALFSLRSIRERFRRAPGRSPSP